MKITANREPPVLQPARSFTIELSVDQLRYIKWLSAVAATSNIATSLYNKLHNIPELNIAVNHSVEW